MTKPQSTREQADLKHLARVRAMIAEVNAAISAIEHNNLPKLQAAIANQERICNELVVTQWTPAPIQKNAKAPETMHQVQAAYAALAQANRVYTGVLKRSKRTVALLSALYEGVVGEGHNVPLSEKIRTLSCEV